MYGKVLDTVDQKKDLGIVITKDLKESEQYIQTYGKQIGCWSP